jgi:hypothetical protein
VKRPLAGHEAGARERSEPGGRRAWRDAEERLHVRAQDEPVLGDQLQQLAVAVGQANSA